MKKAIATALFAAAAVVSLPAVAGYSHCGGGSTDPYCKTVKLSDAGSSGSNLVSVDAYYNSSGSTTLIDAYSKTYYSGVGYGVRGVSGESTSSPQHAMDNDGKFEWLMLSFDKAVRLDEITVGWNYDADMTILASNAPSTDLNGWNFIENVYYNGGQNTGSWWSSPEKKSLSLTSEICASYWLIGALNPKFGANDANLDYFKVYSVQACTDCGTPGTGVAEPGSLALAGLGLLGVIGLRRRRS